MISSKRHFIEQMGFAVENTIHSLIYEKKSVEQLLKFILELGFAYTWMFLLRMAN